MKITLNHNKLSKALSYTSKAVSSKPNIPILSNVLIEVSRNSLKLSATNLDMGIKMWIPGSAESEGKTTVNAKFIADFVSAASSEKVEIAQKENNVIVTTENSKANFNTIPAEEFPVLPKVSEKPLFTITSEEFTASMEKVLFACSTDMSAGKIQQSGVLFEIDKKDLNKVTFVGLDGFRLSLRVAEIHNLDESIQKEEIIVPAKYLAEIVRIVGDNPEVENIEVYLSQNNSQIIFKIEDIEFSIRLLEGPYPDYKRILPDSHSYTFEVDKKDIDNALKVINTFARSNLGNKTLFDFDIETSRVILKSAVTDIGDNETVINVSNIDGESDLNTAYTLRYLQDLVNHVKGDTLVFETKGPLAASVFKDKDDDKFTHLIMPMRREV